VRAKAGGANSATVRSATSPGKARFAGLCERGRGANRHGTGNKYEVGHSICEVGCLMALEEYMRLLFPVTCVVALLTQVPGIAQQAPTAPQKSPPPAAAPLAGGPALTGMLDSAAVRLPIKRVVLYKNGVGFFEHLGRVRGTEQVTIDFTSSQLNDVLMSLTTVDLGNGKVTGVSFNTDDPANRKLGALSLPLGEDTTLLAVLSALRGARVEVQGATGLVTGRILAVEQRTRVEGDKQVDARELAIVTDAGEIKSFDVTSRLSVRVLEGDLRTDIRRYLDIVSSTRQKDLRRMSIATSGVGERQLYVSYISEVPIWKSTYRLVLPAKAGDKPLLQGWAIVDNTIGEDWTNVELSLVAGSPQSFIQPLSQPFYGRRPVIPLPSAAQLTPQTHDAALSPDAKPEAAQMMAPPAPMAATRAMRTGGGAGAMVGGVPGGVVGGVVGGVADAPLYRSVAESAIDALYADANSVGRGVQGRELGDLFEYRLKEPVTIRKNQSALVPIVAAQVEAERVSVWSASTPQRPRSAVWMTNSTPFTLDGGSFAVLEDATFTGEGLMDAVKPGEKRLLSYAADLALLVDAKQDPGGPERVSSVRIAKGVMIFQREYRDKRTYTVRNEDAKARMLVIEHPNRAGWKLVSATKPDETAPSVYRFRVPVAAKSTAVLAVEEVRPVESTYQVSAVTDEQLTLFVSQRALTPEVEQALRTVMAKKAEVAAVASEITARNSETSQIFRDQERLRENLKALKGSAEEKTLVTRYTRQLDEQETRLDLIKREIADAQAKQKKLQGELETLVQALSFDGRK